MKRYCECGRPIGAIRSRKGRICGGRRPENLCQQCTRQTLSSVHAQLLQEREDIVLRFPGRFERVFDHKRQRVLIVERNRVDGYRKFSKRKQEERATTPSSADAA